MSILTEIQKTAANADEKIKHLYETAFPEGEKIPWDDLMRLIEEMSLDSTAYYDGEEFIGFAKDHAELFFYVTRIGCGIAGFKDSDVAHLFRNAVELVNICLPKSFVDILKDSAEVDIYQAAAHHPRRHPLRLI